MHVDLPLNAVARSCWQMVQLRCIVCAETVQLGLRIGPVQTGFGAQLDFAYVESSLMHVGSFQVINHVAV